MDNLLRSFMRSQKTMAASLSAFPVATQTQTRWHWKALRSVSRGLKLKYKKLSRNWWDSILLSATMFRLMQIAQKLLQCNNEYYAYFCTCTLLYVFKWSIVYQQYACYWAWHIKGDVFIAEDKESKSWESALVVVFSCGLVCPLIGNVFKYNSSLYC